MKKFSVLLSVLATLLIFSTIASASVVDSNFKPYNKMVEKKGPFTGSEFSFNDVSEYDSNSLSVLKEKSYYEVSLNVKEIFRDQKEKSDYYLADIAVLDTRTGDIIDFNDGEMEIYKDKMKSPNNSKKVTYAHVMAFDNQKDYRLDMTLLWETSNKKTITGSAILVDQRDNDVNKQQKTFLTLGELTETIKTMKVEKKSITDNAKNDLKLAESVLIQDEYADGNNIRVSLNRSDGKIKRYSNQILFVAAAPKKMDSDYPYDPEITWLTVKVRSYGTNAFVVKPFANASKPQVGSSVSVGFSYLGIGGGVGWNVQSPTPHWYQGTTGEWSFDPEGDEDKFEEKGVPMEGYIYADQLGEVKMDADTDISWTEYYYNNNGGTGISPVYKNEVDDHPNKTFQVVSY